VIHEWSDISPSEEVGHSLQIVQRKVLFGQEDHKMLSQCPAETLQLFTFEHLAQVKAGHRCAEGAGYRSDGITDVA
jgi:hypothetical protein